MSASLVGSEMCIRDSYSTPQPAVGAAGWPLFFAASRPGPSAQRRRSPSCLLYTSDAADDM
eukprot:14680802-Alexandrium_andersonii.AAC.1